ncbi:MAG TPA: hypothetical protein VFK80_09730, partial [Limnochordia bacterium]|nr:hypothetical protein [Limnochordia bacterium]
MFKRRTGGNGRMPTLHMEAKLSGDWWVAQCLEVSVVSQGKTLAEAKANLARDLRWHIKRV